MTLSTLNILLLVILVVLGIAIWFTANQILCIIFLVILIIGGLNITGVLGSIFNRDRIDQ